MRFILLFSILCSLSAEAKLVTQEVPYTIGDKKMVGYVAYDDAKTGSLPAILIVHDWLGLTDKTKNRANMIAELGYLAFAADIYGEGIRPANSDEAGKLAGRYKADRKTFRQHLNAAFDQMKKFKNADTKKMAAIGYCFGGTGVIELARSGTKLNGVVSFHGGLDSPTPKDGKNIKTKVLALHGADDPYVSAEDLAAFESEMRSNKVDWQLIKYGNSVHSFTDKSAGNDNKKGAAYNALADARSWKDMQQFFADIF